MNKIKAWSIYLFFFIFLVTFFKSLSYILDPEAADGVR